MGAARQAQECGWEGGSVGGWVGVGAGGGCAGWPQPSIDPPPPSPNPRCWQAGSHFNEDVEGKGAEAEFAKLPTEDKEAGPSSAASSTTKA